MSIIYDIIIFVTALVKTFDFCRDEAVKLNRPDETTTPATVSAAKISNNYFFS